MPRLHSRARLRGVVLHTRAAGSETLWFPAALPPPSLLFGRRSQPGRVPGFFLLAALGDIGTSNSRRSDAQAYRGHGRKQDGDTCATVLSGRSDAETRDGRPVFVGRRYSVSGEKSARSSGGGQGVASNWIRTSGTMREISGDIRNV